MTLLPALFGGQTTVGCFLNKRFENIDPGGDWLIAGIGYFWGFFLSEVTFPPQNPKPNVTENRPQIVRMFCSYRDPPPHLGFRIFASFVSIGGRDAQTFRIFLKLWKWSPQSVMNQKQLLTPTANAQHNPNSGKKPPPLHKQSHNDAMVENKVEREGVCSAPACGLPGGGTQAHRCPDITWEVGGKGNGGGGGEWDEDTTRVAPILI